MSKTPFTDFLWKLHKDPDHQKKCFDKVREIFEAEGLTPKQIAALLSGDRSRVEKILEDEGGGDIGKGPYTQSPTVLGVSVHEPGSK